MNRYLFDNALKYRLTRHLVFFLFTVSAFAVILYLQNIESGIVHSFFDTLLNAIFFFAYAYLTIFLLIPEFLLKKKIIWFIMFFLLVGVALSALKLVVSDQIFYSAISPENIQPKGMMNLRFIVVNTKDMTFIVAVFCIAKYAKDFIYIDRIRKELEDQAKEAQRKLFQSQFDPHFLFNTINNMYALSMLNPQKTREVIHRMKIVLNYIIQEIQKEFVNLLDEISLVENYIQLERLRYGQRLKVDFNTAGNITSGKIPPMVLFFLVENCFKHGSSLDAGSPWIKVNVKADTYKIVIVIENSKPVTLVDENSNNNRQSQLPDLQKRLNIIYSPQGFDLKIIDRKDTFKVELELREEIEIQRNKYR